MNPAPIPAQIHDILEAVPISPYPTWVVVSTGVVGVVFIALLAWFLFLRRKPAPALTAREKAIAGLVRLHGEEYRPYEFAVMISDVLRRYLDEAYGLRATTATSLEFLESLRESPVFDQEEKQSLAHFLEAVDLLKFARVEAGGEELERLFEAAEAVVRKGTPVETPEGGSGA